MNYLDKLTRGKTGEQVVEILLKAGVIPLSIMTHAVIYERYLHYAKTKKKRHAVLDSASDFKVDVSTVYRIVKQFDLIKE